MAPFVIFSLPRSRSAWLSAYLSRPGAIVGHDIGIGCASPEEFLARLSHRRGTCETGAAFAWRLMPGNIHKIVVNRPVEEVCASLARFGIDGIADEIERRAAHLAEISAIPGTLTIDWRELSHLPAIVELHQHCGVPFDHAWFAMMAELNIQVDVMRELARARANAGRIATLKAIVAERLCDA